MIIDAAELDAAHAYKLLIGSIIPRAVAWVSTVSTGGVANLAPISFFTAVGRKPPMVSITLQPQADGVTLKDTFINIRDTGEFVTNLVTLPQADAMHGSAYGFEPHVDEFRSEEHTSELQSHVNLVCRLLLEKQKNNIACIAWRWPSVSVMRSCRARPTARSSLAVLRPIIAAKPSQPPVSSESTHTPQSARSE